MRKLPMFTNPAFIQSKLSEPPTPVMPIIAENINENPEQDMRLTRELTAMLRVLTLIVKGKGYSYQEKYELISVINQMITHDLQEKYQSFRLPPIQDGQHDIGNKRPRMG